MTKKAFHLLTIDIYEFIRSKNGVSLTEIRKEFVLNYDQFNKHMNLLLYCGVVYRNYHTHKYLYYASEPTNLFKTNTKNTTKETDLKRCPFCGSYPRLIDGKLYFVYCENCKCTTRARKNKRSSTAPMTRS